MPTYQAFNSRSKAWVKYKLYDGKFKVVDVKQREPMKKFKDVPVKGNKK